MKRTIRGTLLSGICGFALTAAWPLTALAQEGGNTREVKELPDNLIVIGEKVERSIFETPSSVGIITGEQITERSLESLSDVFDQLANVSTRFDGQGFSIRGIANSSVTGGTNDPLATIYLDGATLSGFVDTPGSIDTWDLSQVEVFRGAQSTNQGRNTLAGAVIARTADPTYDWEAKGRLRFAEGKTRIASGTVNIPLLDDQLAARITVDYKKIDGFIDNITLGQDDFGFRENFTARGKILFEPQTIPNLRNILTVSFNSRNSGIFFVDDANPSARESSANIDGRSYIDQTIVTWEAEYDFEGPWSLFNVLSYNKAEFDDLDDDDSTAIGGINRRERINDTDTISEEFRIHFDNDRINAFAGIYYLKEQEDNFRTIITGISIPDALPASLAPFGPLIAPFYDDPFLLDSVDNNDREIENYAGFANIEFDINALITLHGGLRYDYESKDFFGGRNANLGSPLPDPASVPGALQALVTGINGLLMAVEGENPEILDTNYDAWLPSMGVVFNWTDNFTTSLLAKRSYRAGGASVSLILGQTPYDPEFAWTYEAGLRAAIPSLNATIVSNLFYMDWSDMQVLEMDGADFVVTNAASASSMGAELEIQSQPIDNLFLFASVGYVDTEFDEFMSPTGGDFSGNEFPNAPNWTMNIGGTWRHDSGLFFHADANYQSSAFVDPDNENPLDSRTVVNGKIGYDFDHGSIEVFARNLLDEDYITQINLSNPVVRVGEPRVVGVEMRLTY